MDTLEDKVTRLQDVNSDLVSAVNAQTQEVIGKMGAIDARMSAKESEVDQHIAQGLERQPSYRITKNQRLLGNAGSINHWVSGGGCTYSLVQEVSSSRPWAERTEEERALLTALGLGGVDYLYNSFNIWKVEWSTRSPTRILYQHINTSIKTTVAGMVKLLSGGVSEHWAEGAVQGEWRLCGEQYARRNLGYTYCHPHRTTDSGAMLFALPAVVTGSVPLEQGVWGLYPYIGDAYDE